MSEGWVSALTLRVNG